MEACNVVRMRVKPGWEAEFLALNDPGHPDIPGMLDAWLVKTGDRDYCYVARWVSMEALAEGRAAMVAELDRMRHMLEDLGGRPWRHRPGLGRDRVEEKDAVRPVPGTGARRGVRRRSREVTMVAFNVVRARVRPEYEAEFLRANDEPGHEVERGLRCMSLVRTGERELCLIGEWDSAEALATARSALGAWLERMRPMLEAEAELSGQCVARLRPKVEPGDWRSC